MVIRNISDYVVFQLNYVPCKELIPLFAFAEISPDITQPITRSAVIRVLF